LILTELRFELKKVNEKIRGAGRGVRRSMYDPILDAFLEGGDGLACVDVEGLSPYHLRSMLKYRIDARGLSGTVEVSVINGAVYLERIG